MGQPRTTRLLLLLSHLLLLLLLLSSLETAAGYRHRRRGDGDGALSQLGQRSAGPYRKYRSLLARLRPMQRKLMVRMLDEQAQTGSSKCSPACLKNGVCNEELGRCDCPRHYSGPDCTVMSNDLKTLCTKFGFKMATCVEEKQYNCLNSCNWRGVCVGGFCRCNPGFYGTDCALSLDATGLPVLLAGQDYQLRKKPPRIYIYELPPSLNNNWYNAGRLDRPLFYLFWQRLLSAGVRTSDGDNADYYYLPIKMRMGGFDSANALATVAYVKQTWPWWNKTQGGHRHLLIQTGDMGRLEASEPARAALTNVTWITHWGLHKHHPLPNWPASHRPGKDIVVPIFLQSSLVSSYGMHTSPLHPLAEPVNRSQTFFFAGRICGDRKEPIPGQWPNCDLGSHAPDASENGYSAGTRQRVHYHHANRSGYKVVVSTKTYARDMARTRFCLAPTGGGHGKRNVLVSMLGCVPVTVTDNVYQPFEPEINWSDFSIPLLESQIPELNSIIENLAPEAMASLQSRLRCGAQHIFWSSIYGSVLGEDGRYDSFETLLEILRMKLKYPDLAPEQYATEDEEFRKFMHCESFPEQDPPDLCSYAELKSKHFPCKECSKPQNSHFLRPGGAICCSERELAKCPRLWV